MPALHAHAPRVLVVEDEYFLAQDLAEALSANGMSVAGPVSSAQEAIELLRSDRAIRGAVLDVKLGDHDAFPTADVLQELGIPFVFATGYGQRALPDRFSWVPRWEKPVDPRALAGRLRRYLLSTAGDRVPAPSG